MEDKKNTNKNTKKTEKPKPENIAMDYDKDINDISVEEFEEEDNAYIDEGLVDEDDIIALNNMEDNNNIINVNNLKDGGIHTPNESEMLVDYKKEYENFTADGEIYGIALNSDKGVIVLGDGEDTTYFYDLNKKELIKKEKINKDSVVNVCFSSDNKFLATASLDGSVNIFDTEEYKVLHTVNGSFSDINWMEWHPKGPVLAFGAVDGSVWVYHAQNIDKFMSFFGHTESVAVGRFSSDGKYLISGSEDTTVKVWDLKNECLLHTIKGIKFHTSEICSMAVGKKKNIVASGSVENELAIANYENAQIVHYFSGENKDCSIEAIEFCNE